MIIENEVIKLAPLNLNQIRMTGQILGTRSKKNLSLSQTQIEILEQMNGSTISKLIQNYMSKGLLISYKSLLELVQFLSEEDLIQTAAFKNYFSSYAKDEPDFLDEFLDKISGQESEIGHLKTELSKIPFFRSLEPYILDTFVDHAKVIESPAQILVCQMGQKQRSLFTLLRGEASVFKRDPHGKRRKVASLKEGSVFGEVGFFLDEARTADVITEKKCTIARFKYVPEIFDHLIQKDKAKTLQKRFWVVHALLKSEVFHDLPDDCFDALAFAGDLRSYPANTVLCKEGDQGNVCYVVVQGNLVVSKKGQSLRVLQQGDCFGEIALLLSQGKRTATVQSQTEVLLLEIPFHRFYQLMAENLFLAGEFEQIAKSRIQADQKK